MGRGQEGGSGEGKHTEDRTALAVAADGLAVFELTIAVLLGDLRGGEDLAGEGQGQGREDGSLHCLLLMDGRTCIDGERKGSM